MCALRTPDKAIDVGVGLSVGSVGANAGVHRALDQARRSEAPLAVGDQRQLSPHLIDRLTKHEEEGGPGTLSRTTLRYAGGDVDLARALETGKVTRHL
ncbi:hypothetical protein DIPPA_13715 [Diplonema papillatum]|nr:hypothetical protein DIPPA_13715 [Diplonema papillatum]